MEERFFSQSLPLNPRTRSERRGDESDLPRLTKHRVQMEQSTPDMAIGGHAARHPVQIEIFPESVRSFRKIKLDPHAKFRMQPNRFKEQAGDAMNARHLFQPPPLIR
jgi:hypothetical protein